MDPEYEFERFVTSVQDLPCPRLYLEVRDRKESARKVLDSRGRAAADLRRRGADSFVHRLGGLLWWLETGEASSGHEPDFPTYWRLAVNMKPAGILKPFVKERLAAWARANPVAWELSGGPPLGEFGT